MKSVIVTRNEPFMSVKVNTTDDLKVFNDVELLELKKGDDFRKFYENNRNNLTFEKAEYYTMRFYLEEEKVEWMQKKNTTLKRLIQEFKLEV